MDWSNKSWEVEDKLFSPKRKVNNKKSHFIPHLSGYLFSYKMNRDVGYESFWGECLFYYYLELDPKTIRYYEQPVEVPIVNLTKDNELSVWAHVPDVLVFRQGNKPLLYQIKGSNTEIEQDPRIESKCREYATERKWVYEIIYPKKLPDVIKSNILLLNRFLKPRSYYPKWEEELMQKVAYLSEITVLDLAKSFSGKVDYRMILPLVYHLIAKGQLRTNINFDIDEKSLVQIGNIVNGLENLFDKDGV
jgi:hypothetical protein